jgi:hypothetical protein
MATEQERSEAIVSRSFSYQSLSGYQLSLFEGFIVSEFPPGITVEKILTGQASLRSKTRLAQALLFRNDPGDKENAIAILKWVLKNQHTDENSANFGMWKTNTLNDRLDQNWREFVGCDLIIIYLNYQNLLPEYILTDIKNGLILAARGALKRNVGADYTNISVMSAFLMNFVGKTFNIEELKAGGLKKAIDIYNLYQRQKSFSEYNSPTYYGVTLIGLALWRELASDQIKTMGIELERLLWEEIAGNYNPVLKNLTGPYFRGYGMDMKKYYSITGIWIALAMNEEKLAPLPRGRGAKEEEMSNISPIMHLGLAIPKPVMLQLKEFTPRLFIDRSIPNKYPGDTLKHVTEMVYADWMMGGLWGSRRAWNQIKTGTIHWKNSNGETEWLLVPGDGKTNIRVTDTSMKIYRADEKSTDFSIFVYSKNLSTDNFLENKWSFKNMELNILSVLKRNIRKIVDSKVLYNECALSEEYPAVMKITFHIPPVWRKEDLLLEITPSK